MHPLDRPAWVHEIRQYPQAISTGRDLGLSVTYPAGHRALGASRFLPSRVSRTLNVEFTQEKHRSDTLTQTFQWYARSRAKQAGLRTPLGVTRANSTAGYVADRRSGDRIVRADALLIPDAVGMGSNRGRPARWTTEVRATVRAHTKHVATSRVRCRGPQGGAHLVRSPYRGLCRLMSDPRRKGSSDLSCPRLGHSAHRPTPHSGV